MYGAFGGIGCQSQQLYVGDFDAMLPHGPFRRDREYWHHMCLRGFRRAGIVTDQLPAPIYETV